MLDVFANMGMFSSKFNDPLPKTTPSGTSQGTQTNLSCVRTNVVTLPERTMVHVEQNINLFHPYGPRCFAEWAKHYVSEGFFEGPRKTLSGI